MEYVMIASSVFSGLSQIQQASAQKSAYQYQAKVAEASASREALNYEIRATETLKKLRAANSANVARGFAGGILGTEGSSLAIRDVNDRVAGVDYMRDIDNAALSLTMGQAQAKQLTSAGDIAFSSGVMGGLGTIGMGAYKYSTIGSAPAKTKTATETREA
jgi:hypothetical protein